MQRVSLVLFLLCFSLNCLSADGRQLLGSCSTWEALDASGGPQAGDENMDNMAYDTGYCLGVVLSVAKAIDYVSYLQRTPEAACIPKGQIANEELIRTTLNYLRKNLQQLNEDDVVLTIKAFREAYPCN